MKTKISKLIKLTAAGLFLIALAINVKVTLDDPFAIMSEQAIATGSGSSSDSGYNDSGYNDSGDYDGGYDGVEDDGGDSNAGNDSSAGFLGKDEVRDMKTFQPNSVLWQTEIINSSGKTSVTFGGGDSLPSEYGVLKVEGKGSHSVEGTNGKTTVTYEITPPIATKYHRWDCDDSLGSCKNSGAGTEWRLATDPLPARAGFYDSF